MMELAFYFTRFNVPLCEDDSDTLAQAQEEATKRAMATGQSVVVYKAIPVGVVEVLDKPVEWREL